MIIVPVISAKYFFLIKKIDKIIEAPIKCNIPNKTGCFGNASRVKIVINNPATKTSAPCLMNLISYFCLL